MFLQIVACTFATAGVILFAWCLIGSFLLPVTGIGMITEYRVHGDAPELEQSVRSFSWLRESGIVDMPLRIIDCGLSEDGMRRAAKLAQRHSYIQIVEERPAPL